MKNSTPELAEFRTQLAQRLRVLRGWRLGRHRLAREKVPRRLAEVRQTEGSLDWLLRCAISGFNNATASTETDVSASFVEVADLPPAHNDEPFHASGFEPLSEVLARAEAQGVDFGQLSVHQETQREPYEDWTYDVLVVCDQVALTDHEYAQSIDRVWQDYQAAQLASKQEREDYALYLELHARFGRRAGHVR